MQKDETDKQLVKRFQRGEQGAFDELVRRYHQQIYRMASVSLIVSEHSADVTQEVFLRAYRGLRKFRFQAEPYTWLFRTMKNVCREVNRKERYCDREIDELSSAGSLEDQVADKRMLHRIHGLLEELPQRQREVVLLRIFEDLSVEDTARVMGCRSGTVKALLHKALHKIRRAVAEDDS